MVFGYLLPHSPPSFTQRWRAQFRPRDLTPAEMECTGVAAARQLPRRHPASSSPPLAPPLCECGRRAHPPQASVRAPPSHGSDAAGWRAPFLFWRGREGAGGAPATKHARSVGHGKRASSCSVATGARRAGPGVRNVLAWVVGSTPGRRAASRRRNTQRLSCIRRHLASAR
jgi:hypothetical protein